MDLGTIVFYRKYDEFQDILKHMNGAKEQSLGLDDATFKDHYGYDRQSLFHVLYQSNDMWGFVCHTITKRKGGIAYKVLNHNNKVTIINDSDIYFALAMDDFTYTHWAEMESSKKIKMSPQGTPIMKKPSDSSIKKAKVVKRVFGMGHKMLYQIVSLTDGKPKYAYSNPFNDQWKDYDPYRPTNNPYDYTMKSNWTPPNPYIPQGHPQSFNPMGWRNGVTTFHAVPYLRDNIKPTSFSIVRKMECEYSDLRMFVNFPEGLPLSFA
jgi:hypothetical protein